MTKKIIYVALGLLWLMHPCMAVAAQAESMGVAVHHQAAKKSSDTHNQANPIKKSCAVKRHKRQVKKKQLHAHKSRVIPNDRRDEMISADEGATMPSYHRSFVGSLGHSIGEHLVNLVYKTVDTLRYSAYKLGGTHFDASHGVYIVDCSEYVDNLLATVHPNAFYSLVNSSGSYKPTTQHYYEFFNELSGDEKNYWNKINDATQLQPGDILVFRNNKHHHGASGHVMIVMDKPMADTEGYLVRVADSAPVGHSEDTRQHRVSGIGIGTLLLKVNPHTGQPSAYAWKVGSHWVNNVNFAMARPVGMIE